MTAHNHICAFEELEVRGNVVELIILSSMLQAAGCAGHEVHHPKCYFYLSSSHLFIKRLKSGLGSRRLFVETSPVFGAGQVPTM